MVWFEDPGHWRRDYYKDVLDTPADWGIPSDVEATKRTPGLLMHDGLEEDPRISLKNQVGMGVEAGRRVYAKKQTKSGEQGVLSLVGQVLQAAPAQDIFGAIDAIFSGYRMGKNYGLNKKKKKVSGEYVPKAIQKKVSEVGLFDYGVKESFSGKHAYTVVHKGLGFSYITVDDREEMYRVRNSQIKINDEKGELEFIDGKWASTVTDSGITLSDNIKQAIKLKPEGKDLLNTIKKTVMSVSSLSQADDLNKVISEGKIKVNAIAKYMGAHPKRDGFRHYIRVGSKDCYIDTKRADRFSFLDVGARLPMSALGFRGDSKLNEREGLNTFSLFNKEGDEKVKSRSLSEAIKGLDEGSSELELEMFKAIQKLKEDPVVSGHNDLEQVVIIKPKTKKRLQR